MCIVVKESIAKVDREMTDITQTIDTVLRFPTKISYDAMVYAIVLNLLTEIDPIEQGGF